MDEFTKGKKLSRNFYQDIIKKLINVPHGAALVGEGSEVLGYDQPRSTDHNWGPRVSIFVQESEVENINRKIIEEIPFEYNGYIIKYNNPDVEKTETNVEVTTISKWLQNNLKINNIDKISISEWLSFPQQHLLQFVAGEIFYDDLGELTHAKDVLSWYPKDVWLWIMACQWHFIGVNEPFIERTLEAGDTLGSQIVIHKMIRYIMEMCFLQNRTYRPYDKWFGKAFDCLPKNEELKTLIRDTMKGRSTEKQLDCLHKLLIELGKKHNELGISTPIEPRYSNFEVGINSAIRPYKVFNAGEFKNDCLNGICDEKLKKLIWVGAFDQLTHSDDSLINFTDWIDKIRKNYEQELC